MQGWNITRHSITKHHFHPTHTLRKDPQFFHLSNNYCLSCLLHTAYNRYNWTFLEVSCSHYAQYWKNVGTVTDTLSSRGTVVTDLFCHLGFESRSGRSGFFTARVWLLSPLSKEMGLCDVREVLALPIDCLYELWAPSGKVMADDHESSAWSSRPSWITHTWYWSLWRNASWRMLWSVHNSLLIMKKQD